MTDLKEQGFREYYFDKTGQEFPDQRIGEEPEDYMDRMVDIWIDYCGDAAQMRHDDEDDEEEGGIDGIKFARLILAGICAALAALAMVGDHDGWGWLIFIAYCALP